MKKRTIVLAMALLLIIPLAAQAFTLDEWMRQSAGNQVGDDISGNKAIQTKPGYFYGLIVHTDGTNATEINIYDNSTAASGAKLIADWYVTTSSTDMTQSISFEPPVAYEHGIYVDASEEVTITYDIFYRASDD